MTDEDRAENPARPEGATRPDMTTRSELRARSDGSARPDVPATRRSLARDVSRPAGVAETASSGAGSRETTAREADIPGHAAAASLEVADTDIATNGASESGVIPQEARIPTEQLLIASTRPLAPSVSVQESWTPPPVLVPRGAFSPAALVASILALVGALFVAWLFPLGLTAIVLGVLALRRPLESRSVAIWAIVLGALSLVYSAGWLIYAISITG